MKREVSYSEIKKGYEIAKEEYIVIDKSDLDRIELKTTNTIDIKEVDEKELDPILIEKSYYVAPDKWQGGLYRQIDKGCWLLS